MKVEPRVVNELDAFMHDAQRLRDLDAERFRRIFALVRAYVAVFERPDESVEVFASRRAEIAPRRVKVLA